MPLITKNTLLSHQKFLSRLVLVCGVVCFFLWWVALLTHTPLFTSRWLIDWFFFALSTHFFLSLLGITKQKRRDLWYLFLTITITLLMVSRLSAYWWLVNFTLGICWWIAGRYMYRRQRQRLLSRRYRSAREYIGSQGALRWFFVSLLTTVSVLRTLWHTGINCNQFDEILHFSWFQQQVDLSSLGSFLGTDGFLASQAPIETWIDISWWGTLGLLWIFGVVKSQIYDLIMEQKELLNHNLCGLINTQIMTIQDRPWRPVAWIVLLYILIRPLVSILMRLCLPIWILIRHILVRSNIIKKQKKRVIITGLMLE